MRTLALLSLTLFLIFVGFGMKPIRYLLFPPPDLYQPLVEIEIEHESTVYTVMFENEYDGSHMISFAVDSPTPIGQSYAVEGLRVSVVVLKDNHVILEELVDGYLYPFWGHENKHSGIVLLNYEVPQDMPRSEPLEVRVQLISGYGDFEKRYGRPRLLISKISDK